MLLLLSSCGQKPGGDTEAEKAPIPDGVYSADFKTDGSMFHVNEAHHGKGVLTVKDGKMTIHVSLPSKNTVNLFRGTAEEAQKDGAKLIEPTVDNITYEDGTTEEVYGFDIPVPYLDKEFDCALVGTKGFTFEGPYYLDRRGRIRGWDEENYAHAQKLIERETERLYTSFEAARKDGYRKFICFLHYPPTNIMETESAFTRMAKHYHAEKLIYAHCHGETRFHDSLEGVHDGVEYALVSGDCLRWRPMKILD